MGKKNRKYVYIFILTLIILYIIIFVIPKVTGAFETTELLEAGSLQGTEETTCCIVRSETVYEAGAAGKLKYLAKEGTHIRKGTQVIELAGDEGKASGEGKEESEYNEIIKRLSGHTVRTVSGKAQSSGIISSYIDGYEGYFTPEKMEKLKYEDVKELDIEAEDVRRKSTREGEPVFKISDNDNWYLVCWVEAASVARYEVGNSVAIQLPAGNVKATVKEILADGEQWKIIFRSNRYYEAFSKSRIEEARIISQDYSGLIVKNSSITTRDGKSGVMVRKTGGEFEFTQVKVLARDGDYSVIQDVSFIDENGNSVNTVHVYDEILKRPGKGT